MTEQKLYGILAAAILAVSALFAGNSLLARSRAAAPEPETVAPTTAPAPTETQPPETAAPTEPEDARIDRLRVAAEGMDGTHIFVYDLAQEKMLYCSTDTADRLYPASITKLYTAWLALRYLSPDTVVTAGNELALVQPGSSLAYISRGCRLTVEMLVEGMLLPSGNDAAYVLSAAAGRAIADDPTLDGELAVQTFVSEMNREAQRLGLVDSHFTNPDGYHAGGHYSCPADMALIAALAIEDETIAKFAKLEADAVVFESGERITWYNTNRLVNPHAEQYIPEALGLKTGYTTEAGYCILAAFDDGAQRILIGIFGAEKNYPRYENAAALWQCCG